MWSFDLGCFREIRVKEVSGPGSKSLPYLFLTKSTSVQFCANTKCASDRLIEISELMVYSKFFVRHFHMNINIAFSSVC